MEATTIRPSHYRHDWRQAQWLNCHYEANNGLWHNPGVEGSGPGITHLSTAILAVISWTNRVVPRRTHRETSVAGLFIDKGGITIRLGHLVILLACSTSQSKYALAIVSLCTGVCTSAALATRFASIFSILLHGPACGCWNNEECMQHISIEEGDVISSAPAYQHNNTAILDTALSGTSLDYDMSRFTGCLCMMCLCVHSSWSGDSKVHCVSLMLTDDENQEDDKLALYISLCEHLQVHCCASAVIPVVILVVVTGRKVVT